MMLYTVFFMSLILVILDSSETAVSIETGFDAGLLRSSFTRESSILKLVHALTKAFGVFRSPIPITCLPASLSLDASLVKSLSLVTRQNPSILLV